VKADFLGGERESGEENLSVRRGLAIVRDGRRSGGKSQAREKKCEALGWFPGRRDGKEKTLGSALEREGLKRRRRKRRGGVRGQSLLKEDSRYGGGKNVAEKRNKHRCNGKERVPSRLEACRGERCGTKWPRYIKNGSLSDAKD